MYKTHKKLTVEQFTKQAVPFSTAASVRNDDVLDRIVRLGELTSEDETLDVACGPGLLVCAFAPLVRHATGMDLTPAMLHQARQLQQKRELMNVSWVEGDVMCLPYADGSFSVVTSRYAFHHFVDPLAVLEEMGRVCKPSGRILVIDSSPSEDKAAAFNAMERLRDPSHIRALTAPQFLNLFVEAGIPATRVENLRLLGDLESLLARSFTSEANANLVREAFQNSLVEDVLDVSARRDNHGKIHYAFPIILLKARKAGTWRPHGI
jgi:ubiquinone/menaquinone biosynthesis C-methylase UbiE